MENRWAGAGNQGERFRDPQHLYADDLDVFGRGSLFELLSSSRTAAGDRFLASWLLAPGELAEVLERQAAVEELRPRLELREDLAVMGEEIRAAADDRALKQWGEQPAIRFFPGARIVAPILAAAAIATLALWMTGTTSLIPFLCVVAAEMGVGLALRSATLAWSRKAASPKRLHV